MSVEMDNTGDGALLNLIEQLGQLEWRKMQSRYPSSWIENKFQRVDHSGFPPYCSFRFTKEDPHLIACLKSAIDAYVGKIEWIMIGHERDDLTGTNWMICPRRYWEMREAAQALGVSAGQYMAEHEPEFGPIAYDDLPDLTRHVRDVFSK